MWSTTSKVTIGNQRTRPQPQTHPYTPTTTPPPQNMHQKIARLRLRFIYGDHTHKPQQRGIYNITLGNQRTCPQHPAYPQPPPPTGIQQKIAKLRLKFIWGPHPQATTKRWFTATKVTLGNQRTRPQPQTHPHNLTTPSAHTTSS